MLGEQAVNTIVTAPQPGEALRAGEVRFAGIALAGGGRRVERVELSSDGGRNWTRAELGAELETWAWRFWQARLALAAGEHEIAVRAWDSASQTQPPAVEQVWNFKGYMNNAWARVAVSVRSD